MAHGFLVGTAELRGEGLACPFVAGRGVGGRWGRVSRLPEPDEQSQSLSFPRLRVRDKDSGYGVAAQALAPSRPHPPGYDPPARLWSWAALMVTQRAEAEEGEAPSLPRPPAGPAGTPTHSSSQPSSPARTLPGVQRLRPSPSPPLPLQNRGNAPLPRLHPIYASLGGWLDPSPCLGLRVAS